MNFVYLVGVGDRRELKTRDHHKDQGEWGGGLHIMSCDRAVRRSSLGLYEAPPKRKKPPF